MTGSVSPKLLKGGLVVLSPGGSTPRRVIPPFPRPPVRSSGCFSQWGQNAHFNNASSSRTTCILVGSFPQADTKRLTEPGCPIPSRLAIHSLLAVVVLHDEMFVEYGLAPGDVLPRSYRNIRPTNSASP